MFDSGFGGLTVARALIDLLPAEDVVYIGDTGRYPYGSKPLEAVRQYAHELAWSLLRDCDAKAIVVACNTATVAGLDELRAELPIPIIDVIQPGANVPVKATRSGRVGVIGTVGTMASGAYVRAVARNRCSGAPVERCMSRLRRVRRARPNHRRRGHGARRTSVGPDPGGQGRCVVARVHALSVPRENDQRGDGRPRHTGQFGRRDGLRCPRPSCRSRPAAL